RIKNNIFIFYLVIEKCGIYPHFLWHNFNKEVT
ncbi:MAG: hypothetical protein ACJA0H_001365, partial [Francisellaceae bacterium]